MQKIKEPEEINILEIKECEHPRLGRAKFCDDCRRRRNKLIMEIWNIEHPTYYTDYREKHKSEYLKYLENYRQTHKEESQKYRETNRTYSRDYGREAGEKLRLKVLKYYSPELKCTNCKEEDTDVLSIDHIDLVGRKHRQEIGGHLYRWLKNNDYPSGFQVLCMNCQLIKESEKRRLTTNDKYLKKREAESAWKTKAISIYSNNDMNCKKCGKNDIRFLTIDHIKNKGSKQRRELKINGKMFYRWLHKNNYPKDYQVLCMNCNTKKARTDKVWNKI